MASEEEYQEKKKALIEKLLSSNEEIVLGALEDSKFVGDKDAVAPILDIVIKTDWLSARSKALEVLSSLKDEDSVSTFFTVFGNEKYKNHHPQLLSAIWLAGMDASAHMAQIVKVSLASGYEAVLEAHTILDNTESSIPEEQLLEAQIACKSYLDKNPKSDKKIMVEAMLKALESRDTYE